MILISTLVIILILGSVLFFKIEMFLKSGEKRRMF